MRQSQAIRTLTAQDRLGRHVFTVRDLARLFREDSDRTLKASLQRMVRSGVLIRAVKGVYVFAFSAHRGSDTLELVAKAMRRGEYNYVSLESALAGYGVISQIPVDRLTVMTTGRRGEYKTAFGVIEFTHTSRPSEDILESTVDVGRPLRRAKKTAALRDLRRVGRNTHLVNQEAADAS